MPAADHPAKQNDDSTRPESAASPAGDEGGNVQQQV